jgi:hypothetical protein
MLNRLNDPTSISGVLKCFLFSLLLTASVSTASDHHTISGVVRDATGPLANAVVRIQATNLSALSEGQGQFNLQVPPSSQPVRLTAFAPGYYIAGPVTARPGDTDVTLLLKKHPEEDHTTYEWVSAFSSSGQEGNCQKCHSDPEDSESRLPFDEWMRDAHGNSALNRRFLSMYNGTDLSGAKHSPITRYAFTRDYGRVPVRPEPRAPYYGPGFKLDSPDASGNCAACHMPNAAVRAPYETDPDAVTGIGLEGVGCDLCHKIWAVRLNPANGLPYPNTPGVMSIVFRRPATVSQLFIGPYDDVAPGKDTYSPLQNRSEICSPCHFGQFWGVQIYNSFGEWLASSYSDPVKGKTCQDCHMPRRGATRCARADKGAPQRDPRTNFSHLMPGATDVQLLRDTARLQLEARRLGDILSVSVTVINEKAGHHIPTDHPARNILLIVSVTGKKGREMKLLKGPVLPDWAGKGSNTADYAGRPGRGYAKILEELWTEVSPTAAYWNPTVLREDTRIPAHGQDLSTYEFRAPPHTEGPVHVTARLIFRRAFQTLIQQKTWDVPDILMGEKTLTIR